MELKHLFSKRKTVAEGLRVPVTRHFIYSQIGVRGRHAPIDMYGTFVTTEAPGVGFFVKSSDSHSYRQFVREVRKGQKQNFWTLIARKEPNFDRQIRRVEEAVAKESNEVKLQLLTTYQQTLYVAKEAEQMEKIVRGIKDKMGHHTNKHYVSVLSHYKSRLATLDHDIRAAQYNVKNHISEEGLQQWGQVVEKFHGLVDARRLWSVQRSGLDDEYIQVFADMGIFDFIQSPYDTPILRDHEDVHYYFYPNGIIRSRSSVDFDVFNYKDITINTGVVELSTLAGDFDFTSSRTKLKKSKGKGHTDVIGALYGQTRDNKLGQISIPEMGLNIFCNRTSTAVEFVEALNAFIRR